VSWSGAAEHTTTPSTSSEPPDRNDTAAQLEKELCGRTLNGRETCKPGSVRRQAVPAVIPLEA